MEVFFYIKSQWSEHYSGCERLNHSSHIWLRCFCICLHSCPDFFKPNGFPFGSFTIYMEYVKLPDLKTKLLHQFRYKSSQLVRQISGFSPFLNDNLCKELHQPEPEIFHPSLFLNASLLLQIHFLGYCGQRFLRSLHTEVEGELRISTAQASLLIIKTSIKKDCRCLIYCIS